MNLWIELQSLEIQSVMSHDPSLGPNPKSIPPQHHTVENPKVFPKNRTNRRISHSPCSFYTSSFLNSSQDLPDLSTPARLLRGTYRRVPIFISRSCDDVSEYPADLEPWRWCVPDEESRLLSPL